MKTLPIDGFHLFTPTSVIITQLLVCSYGYYCLFSLLCIISELDHAQLSFSSKQPSKKKRKSRTAFTNHQIFELEKRFLYQKYLSPADRDEIAAHLGLTNAQVSKQNLVSDIYM